MLKPHLISGQTLAAGIPVYGTLANISATMPGRNNATITWDWLDAHATASARVFAYVDGRMAGNAAAGEFTLSITNLLPGTHALELLLIGDFDTPPARLISSHGNHILLSWDASTSPDCAAYRVYNGATQLAEVRDFVVQDRAQVPPDAGTGAGRISSFGSATGIVNSELTVTITGAGMVDTTFNGVTTTPVAFVQGGILYTDQGACIVFHDPISDYVTGDSWAVQIGPSLSYSAGPLDPGAYTLGVSAVDIAGNESAATTGAPIGVIAVPPEVEGVALQWTDFLQVLLVVFPYPYPAGITEIACYANYDPYLGVYLDRIDTGFPYVISNSADVDFAQLPDGVLKFYLRARNADGIECESLTMYEFNWPPTPQDLGIILSNPTGLKASLLPAGGVRIEWDYFFQDGDSVESFHVYHAASGDPYAGSFDTVVATLGAGYPTRHFSHDFSAGGIFGVRAFGAAMETTNTNTVTLAGDSTAPDAPNVISGGAA